MHIIDGLIVSAFILLFSSIHLRANPKKYSLLITSVVSSILLFLSLLILLAHGCNEGQVPLVSVLFFSCLVFLVPLIKHPKIMHMRLSISLIIIIAFAVNGYFVESYHDDEITGNPGFSSKSYWHTFFTGQYERDKEKVEQYYNSRSKSEQKFGGDR